MNRHETPRTVWDPLIPPKWWIRMLYRKRKMRRR